MQVPLSLLLDPRLTAADKLVGMLLRLQSPAGPARPARLQSSSGLSRPTVLKALSRLAAPGWSTAGGPATPCGGSAAGARVRLPGYLLADRSVGAQGKVLYGVLQQTPGFRYPSGLCSYAGLTALTGAGPNTVKGALRALVQAEWLRVKQKHQLAPIHFTLDNPAVARAEAEIARARQRLEAAPYFGEALMREYLSLLIDSDAFLDNATPGFMVNPFTDELLQLDRYYPPRVAFEFNGPQHYGATERFSGREAARQRGRDHIKLAICVHRGIELRVVHPEDLSLEGMQAIVGSLLPLRNLAGHEPLIAFLGAVGRRYRRTAPRARPAPHPDGDAALPLRRSPPAG